MAVLQWSGYLVGLFGLAVGWFSWRRSRVDRPRAAAEPTEVAVSEARLRAILDHVADGIVTIDGAGIIQSINPAIRRMFGYGSDDIVGREIGILVSNPNESGFDDYLSGYLRGRADQLDYLHSPEPVGRRKDGAT